MSQITSKTLEAWFTHHPPTAEQMERYNRLREAARTFAQVILDTTPPSPDQTAALRHIRDAVMTANASIAIHSHETTTK